MKIIPWVRHLPGGPFPSPGESFKDKSSKDEGGPNSLPRHRGRAREGVDSHQWCTILMMTLKRGLWFLCMITISVVACRQSEPEPTGPLPLFEETFAAGETGNWLMEGDRIGRAAIADERMVLEINAPDTLQFVTLTEPTFDNFSLQVDTRLLAGDLNSSYGVLFRMDAYQTFYRFDITGDGFYMIERHNADGSWTRFMNDWTTSEAINQGFGLLNRLQIEADGPLLSFYVNGILLQEIRDEAFITGNIALDAGTFAEGGLQVAFDNVVIYDIAVTN